MREEFNVGDLIQLTRPNDIDGIVLNKLAHEDHSKGSVADYVFDGDFAVILNIKEERIWDYNDGERVRHTYTLLSKNGIKGNVYCMQWWKKYIHET
jgi:hypothetical protein